MIDLKFWRALRKFSLEDAFGPGLSEDGDVVWLIVVENLLKQAVIRIYIAIIVIIVICHDDINKLDQKLF